MKLLEFYSMREAISRFYTFEPESNGTGRLLAWDKDVFSDMDGDMSESEDMSYEVIAKGSIDDLLDAMRDAEPLSPDDEDNIRDMWDQAIDTGEAVKYDEHSGAEMTGKVGGEDDDYSDEDVL